MQSKLFNRFNLKDRLSAKQFKEFEKRYETFAEIPTICGGFIANNPQQNVNAVHVIKNQKNIRQKLSRKYLESYLESNNSGEYQRVPWIWNVGSNATSIYPSPSRSKIAMVNKLSAGDDKNGSNKKQCVIEIYDQQQLIDTIYPPSGSFGDIHTKRPFCGISWNKQENLIAFIAEKEDKKSTNYFEDKTLITKYTQNAADKEEKDAAEGDDKLLGQSYEFEETFGEQMNGAKSTTLFVYDLAKKQLFDLSEIEPDLMQNNEHNVVFSECLFDPNDDSTVLVIAYSTFPRRLGVRFYNTRPTQLWMIKLASFIASDSKLDKCKIFKNIASNDFSPQYLRFSPNGQLLTYLTTDDTFSHKAPDRLQCMKWPPIDMENVSNLSAETIIDIPRNVKSSDVLQRGEFGGIFCDESTPQRCWINDDELILNSYYGHCCGALLINVSKKTVQKLDQFPEISDSFKGDSIKTESARDLYVLDVDATNGRILFVTSSIQRGHTMNIYDVKKKTVSRLSRTIPENVENIDNEFIASIRNIETRVICNTVGGKTDEEKTDNDVYESMLYVPPKGMTSFDRDPVLLLYVHGGPHSCNTLMFSSYMLTLIYSGYAILQVNYRGSIGVSQSFVECLHGQIGDMDVKDCMNAFEYVCSDSKKYLGVESGDKLKKIVMGGSHGGFLTGHFIGQYPNVFVCASSRNPVLNLYSMFGLSDIPDWILCEVGLVTKYNDECLMKPLNDGKQIEVINKMSPNYYLENVVTPYQILCGVKDLRVPMQQAIEYYKILRARNGNQKARLLIYPDCQHSLNDKMDQEFDAWLNIVAWFQYHLQGDQKSESNDNDATHKIDQLLTEISQT